MFTKIRLRSVWLIVPVYLVLARPATVPIAAGATLALAGALLRTWAAGSIRKNRVLATHGPYAFTRNPLYLGSALIGLGFAVAGGRPLFLLVWIGFFGLVYGRAVLREEARLERQFGEGYRRYAAAVPRLMPRLPPWSDVIGATSPALPEGAPSAALAAEPPGVFQLRRYLANREYQAFLAICALFLLLGAKLAL